MNVLLIAVASPYCKVQALSTSKLSQINLSSPIRDVELKPQLKTYIQLYGYYRVYGTLHFTQDHSLGNWVKM